MTPKEAATGIEAGLASVLERIAGACARAGRCRDDVQLVAVTKTVPAARVRELVAAGHRLCGENRIQEALGKRVEVGPGVAWHFIGHLQSNKARPAAGAFELIHSVDDVRLAQDLERHCSASGVRQAVLLQVNVSREATKSGVEEAQLPELLDAVAGSSQLDLRGLMTVPPPADDPAESAPWFRRLFELREAARARTGLALPELSMGMTDDFEVAIAEGATLVRVGRAIFGERPQG